MVDYMTDKELRKLKRTDLLEILYYLQKEIDELKEENAILKEKAAGLSISDSDVSKIAEAVAKAVKGEDGGHSVDTDSSSESAAVKTE